MLWSSRAHISPAEEAHRLYRKHHTCWGVLGRNSAEPSTARNKHTPASYMLPYIHIYKLILTDVTRKRQTWCKNYMMRRTTKAIININKEGIDKLNILSKMLQPKKSQNRIQRHQTENKTKNFYCHGNSINCVKEAVYGIYCIWIYTTCPHAKLWEWLNFNWFPFIPWSQKHRRHWARTAGMRRLAPPLQMVLLQNPQPVPTEQGEHSDC